jgi:hypothetical protein
VGGQLGSYLIDSVIGRGGMSVVFGARHSRLGMPVALKVLAPELSGDDTFRERFLREAQIAAGIDHPNVIPIHDMGLHDDSLYIVMRYVAGGDLKTLLADSGPLGLEQTLRLLTPIALALDSAHRHGLVHRDVKPANILLQRSAAGKIDHVYLTDFGIAKSASFSGALTSAGASIGTMGYMAPEQLEGREVSAQTDVYALAVTLYECITGRVPYWRELAEGIRPPAGPLEPISHTRPDIPVALDDVVARALSRDPDGRPATCEEFIRACHAAAEDESALLQREAPGEVTGTVLSAPHADAAAAQAAPAAQLASDGGGRPDAADADAGAPGRGAARRPLYAALVLVLVAAAAVAVLVLATGASTPVGERSSSALAEVPTNHVTGSGQAAILLDGDTATVTLTTEGLDNGANLVHLMHIHVGGKGRCPPASAARLHNGHLAISTSDGINYYGPPAQALTTRGDTSVSSILAFPRFPSGGALRYTRTIALPPEVAAAIRRNNAVVVVHGTDYDGTGIYSGVLDRSELNKAVPGTATAPALCGRLIGVKNAAAANARSGAPRLLYTASLLRNAGPQVAPIEGVFLCHVVATTGASGDARRPARTAAARTDQAAA